MSKGLTIIGCGMGPDDLTAGMLKIIREAEVLAGGWRHLDWFPDFNGQREVIGAGVRELVPRDKDVLAAARFLATYATRYNLMDVTIKMSTDSAATNALTPIAGRHAEQKIKKDAFATLGIKTYVMEMAFVASFKNSAKFLDDIAMTSPRFFQVKKAQIEKDFPFIRTTLFIRFYYGGELNVKK